MDTALDGSRARYRRMDKHFKLSQTKYDPVVYIGNFSPPALPPTTLFMNDSNGTVMIIFPVKTTFVPIARAGQLKPVSENRA